MKAVYLDDWPAWRARKWAEWTDRYLGNSPTWGPSCDALGPVTVTPGWRLERERRVASLSAAPAVPFRKAVR